MKILIDETSDGWDEKLQNLGFEAYSVRKLKDSDPNLSEDFNVIQYARDNDMVLVTKDRENGRACTKNGFPCIWINDETVFEKMVVKELENMRK